MVHRSYLWWWGYDWLLFFFIFFWIFQNFYNEHRLPCSFFIKEYFEKTFLSSVTRFRSENYTSIVSKQTRTMLAKRDCLEPTGVSPSAALREGDGKPISEVGSSEDRSYWSSLWCIVIVTPCSKPCVEAWVGNVAENAVHFSTPVVFFSNKSPKF